MLAASDFILTSLFLKNFLFFNSALTHLPIHLSMVARFETADKTGKLPRYISALLNFAPHLVGNGFIRSVCHGFACTQIYSCREQACLFRLLPVGLTQNRIGTM